MTSPFTVPRPRQRPGTQVGADSRVESRFESEAAPTPAGCIPTAPAPGYPLRPWSVAVPPVDRTVCAYCGHFHRKTLAGYLPWSKKRRPAKCVCCKEDFDAVFPDGPVDDEVDDA